MPRYVSIWQPPFTHAAESCQLRVIYNRGDIIICRVSFCNIDLKQKPIACGQRGQPGARSNSVAARSPSQSPHGFGHRFAPTLLHNQFGLKNPGRCQARRTCKFSSSRLTKETTDRRTRIESSFVSNQGLASTSRTPSQVQNLVYEVRNSSEYSPQLTEQ